MVREADFIKLQNSPILNHCNTLLEIVKTKKENLEDFGLPELMLVQLS